MGLTLANKITIGRFVAIPVLAAVILYYSPERDYIRWVALGIYLVAEITDVIDGYVARHFRQKTKAGSILDPLADKVLFLTALVCLYKVGADFAWPVRLPLWLVVSFFARDAILIAGGFLIEVKCGLTEMRPNTWGKATAFLQVVCLSAAFAHIPVSLVIWWAALAATLVSGVMYMKEGIKVLNHAGHP